mgnify:CR=1 FL=1
MLLEPFIFLIQQLEIKRVHFLLLKNPITLTLWWLFYLKLFLLIHLNFLFYFLSISCHYNRLIPIMKYFMYFLIIFKAFSTLFFFSLLNVHALTLLSFPFEVSLELLQFNPFCLQIWDLIFLKHFTLLIYFLSLIWTFSSTPLCLFFRRGFDHLLNAFKRNPTLWRFACFFVFKAFDRRWSEGRIMNHKLYNLNLIRWQRLIIIR